MIYRAVKVNLGDNFAGYPPLLFNLKDDPGGFENLAGREAYGEFCRGGLSESAYLRCASVETRPYELIWH